MSFLKKVWGFIKKWWWLILLIVFAAFIISSGGFVAGLQSMASSIGTLLHTVWAGVTSLFSPTGLIGKFLATHSWGTILAVGFGLLAVVSPHASGIVVKHLVDGATQLVDGVGSVAGAVLNQPIVWLAVGGLALFLLLRKHDDSTPVVIRRDTAPDATPAAESSSPSLPLEAASP